MGTYTYRGNDGQFYNTSSEMIGANNRWNQQEAIKKQQEATRKAMEEQNRLLKEQIKVQKRAYGEVPTEDALASAFSELLDDKLCTHPIRTWVMLITFIGMIILLFMNKIPNAGSSFSFLMILLLVEFIVCTPLDYIKSKSDEKKAQHLKELEEEKAHQAESLKLDELLIKYDLSKLNDDYYRTCKRALIDAIDYIGKGYSTRISIIQLSKVLGIGYANAGKIMDWLELIRFVGNYDEVYKAFPINLTKEDYEILRKNIKELQ